MCRSFEVISGKKNKGDKGLLKGLTKMYRDAKYSVAIIPIPVELLEIDTRYQTEVRTDRSLMYLVNNWDENKLLPLIGVPHWEEGKVYLVDGYGRWVASQMVDKEKYTDLQVSAFTKKDMQGKLAYTAGDSRDLESSIGDRYSFFPGILGNYGILL